MTPSLLPKRVNSNIFSKFLCTKCRRSKSSYEFNTKPSEDRYLHCSDCKSKYLKKRERVSSQIENEIPNSTGSTHIPDSEHPNPQLEAERLVKSEDIQAAIMELSS